MANIKKQISQLTNAALTVTN